MSNTEKVNQIAIIQPVHFPIENETVQEVLGEGVQIIDANLFPDEGTSIENTANWDWDRVKTRQAKLYHESIVPVLNANPSALVTYFGIAPIPLMIHLGYLVTQRANPVTARNRRHDKKEKKIANLWKWKGRDSTQDPFQVKTSEVVNPGITEGKDIIVAISSSYQVDLEDARKAVPGAMKEYHIATSIIDPNSISTEEELDWVADSFGELIGEIQRQYSQDVTVHLFGGIPAGLAFMLGTRIHASTHPKIVTYKYDKTVSPESQSPRHRKAIEIGMDSTEPIKVLLVGANAKKSPLLDIEGEFAEIKQILRDSLSSDRFEVRTVGHSTRSDLVDELIRYKPHILHFSGHGTDESDIRQVFRHLEFEDEKGNPDPVKPIEWGSLFENIGYTLQAVILNACHSHSIADQIAPFVGCAVTMTTAIEDRRAISFAKTFYTALADQRSFEAAFKVAKVSAGYNDEAYYQQNDKGLHDAEMTELHDTIKEFSSEELFSKLEEEIDSLLPEVEDCLAGLRKREPAYTWVKEADQKLAEIKSKWGQRRFQVSVMALVKAGKSTLLNCWIGDEYLPSASKTETMRIIRIQHVPDRHLGVLFDGEKEVARGAEVVRKTITRLNQEAREKPLVDRPDMRLEVNIAALADSPLGKYGFDILDTPGTNEAGILPLKGKVERIAKSSDVIIYVLDFTKLNSLDESEILSNLKNWKSGLFERTQTRVFFVVNKIDQINRHDHERKFTRKKTNEYTQDILKREIDLDVDSSDIVLISAERALLSRRVESGNASEGQMADFKQISFGEFGAENATQDEVRKAVPKLLERSGFAELNRKVLGSVIRNRSNILFSSILDELGEIVGNLYNNLSVEKRALQASKEEVWQLSKQIEKISNKVKGVEPIVDVFKKKAIEIVKDILENFENNAFYRIREAFSSSPFATELRPGILNIFGEKDIEISSRDENKVIEQLEQINYMIFNAIRADFSLAWNQIVDALYSEYDELQIALRKRIDPIVREIEAKINEKWDIRLNPQNIFIENPTLDDFFREMNRIMNDLVTVEVKSNLSWVERLLNPIFKLFGFGVEEVRYAKFSFSKNQYRKKVRKGINALAEKAMEQSFHLIENKYIATADQATTGLRNYGAKYIKIMSDSIKSKAKGVVDIEDRIEGLDSDLEKIETLKDGVDRARVLLSYKPSN